MLLSQPNTRNIDALTHEGKVLIVATVYEQNTTKYYYTIKQDGFEDSALQNPYGTGWEDFKLIPLPNDTVGDPSVAEREQRELTDKDGKFILRSVYDSATMGAYAPVQLVSHDGHAYLFRQSSQGTLLVDRFVLDGMTNTLTPKIEVRFKRSRQRYKPLQAMKINSSGQLESVDALDFRDMNDKPFFAPTIELSLTDAGGSAYSMQKGWFDVVITPTNEQDNYRWHIFSCASESNYVHLYSVRADSEYIFDIKDAWFRTVDEITDKVSYDSIPGLIHRRIQLLDANNKPLTVNNGLAAVKYDVQREQETESGPQLMRDASKLMLAVPTTGGIAALAFAIAADGTLAQITDTPSLTPLRQQEREILLPLDLLDEIRAVGDKSPAPDGTITGVRRSEGDPADRVEVQVAHGDPIEELSTGDVVKLDGMRDYNGLFAVTKVDDNTFVIPDLQTPKLGEWSKVETEESGLVFDGQVLSYELEDGRLKVNAVNHGLQSGDKVQIIGSVSYDGEYPVLKHDETSFTIQRLWEESEALNIQIQSRKRRGLIFDGTNDWIEIPLSPELKLTDSFTFEAWVKLDTWNDQTLFALQEMKPGGVASSRNPIEIGVKSGQFNFSAVAGPINYSWALDSKRWIHFALVCDSKTIRVFTDGQEVGSNPINANPTLKASVLSIGAQLDSAGKRMPGALFDGQIADVRLWTTARTAQEIKNNMFLLLTGRETGLAGYWRLGGIALDGDGTERVYDFSVNANHGIVRGSPHAGSIARARTLRGNTTPAVKFVNDELVAVREGATYEERFEFQTTPPTADPKNAENGQPIFAPSLWGRSSRGAADKIVVTPLQPAFEFKKLDDGWWSAACRFIVPEGARLLRGFEIGAVSGSWTTLEIRRPRLTLVSDTVTQSDASELANLKPLAGIQRPEVSLKEIGQLERAERLNLELQDELQRKLKAATDNNLSDQLASARTAKESAEGSYNKIKADYDNALPKLRGEYSNGDMDGEYFHRGSYVDTRIVFCPPGKVVKGVRLIQHPDYPLTSGSGGVLLSLQIEVWNRDGTAYELIYNSGAPKADEKIELIGFIDRMSFQIPDGMYVTGVGFHIKKNRLALKVRAALEDGTNETWVTSGWDEAPSTWFYSEINGDNPYVDTNWVKSDDPTQPITGIWLYQKNNRIAPKVGWYKPAEIKSWNDKLARAEKEKKATLDRYNELLASSNADDQQQQAWQNQINAAQTTRDRLLSDKINPAVSAYMQLAAKAQNTAQAMSPLANAKDLRGLAVQGALLTFAAPTTRLHAMESVAGRVTLTYQENDGALRQTHYDATYGADGKAEEWLVEPYRTAVTLGEDVRDYYSPTFDVQGFGEQVTIEFWARGAQAIASGTFLTATDKDNKTVLRIQLPNDKEEVVWEAGDAKANALDRIAHTVDKRLYRDQWTHWAFVKDARRGEMRVYVNGGLWHKNVSVGKDAVALKQSLAGISAFVLGGIARRVRTDRWKGRIAELRIWNVALNDREIESNSMLTLSGNEPGLAAYYPFNEVQGNEARDLSGNTTLNIPSAQWVPFTAPIGQLYAPPIPLLSEPTTFDGTSTFVQLPTLDLDFSKGMTIEARIRFDALKGSATILELGNGDGGQRIKLVTEERRVQLEIQNDNAPLQLLEEWISTDQIGTFVKLLIVVHADGRVTFYVENNRYEQNDKTLPQTISRTHNYLGRSSKGDEFFRGQIEFVRVYEYAMSDAQVKALVSPIQTDALAPDLLAVEYSRVRVDAQHRKAAMMLRALALVTDDGIRMWDEQRVEELELQWIGNAQINPTLVGYIEGAPPVPSENLTEEQDYNGGSSVELVESSDVEYSWTREQEMRADIQISALVGIKSETSIGLGIQSSAEEVKSGIGGNLGIVYGWQNASTVGASHTEMTSERLELRGTQEEEAHFAHLGQRFVPKDIGYAVVVSGLADVFVTKLKRSRRMVSYIILPVQGVPLDVNTITFLINPAYTMAGSLDGLTGSRATSEQFFRHVPELRSQYGSLYPASYFRLGEAYSLKAQIEKADEQRQAYFHQFNQQLISDALLENQVEDTEFDSAAVGVDAPQSASADLANTNKQITQTEKELDELGTSTQNVDARKQKQSELDALKKKRDELELRQKDEQAERTKKSEARQGDINKKYSDLSTRAHASDSFATWQKKMEDLQIRAGKRNIVNTYVWDGDGGFHAEEQQFASTVEHSIGGSYDFSAGLGVQASIAIAKALVEINVQAQYGITQTMSKSEGRGKALELHVDLSGVESRGITDFRDNPMLPGEKVDRYRFMTFYLENNVNHWHDFFNYVVNPEWLASNDEEARALRQTQNALPNKVWRVLHRVTYVERPALMGFGRTLAKTHRAVDDIRELRQQIDDLNTKMVQMQNEISAKLEQLLNKKA